MPKLVLTAFFLSLATTLTACGTSTPPPGPVVETEPGDHDAGAPDAGNAGNAGPAVDAGFPLSHAVRVIVEPNGNDGAEIVAAIKSAKRTVHLTMYIFTDDDVKNALIERARAGVEVKVVLNKTFPGNGFNQSALFTALERGGVKVAWASAGFTFTHAKALLIDGVVGWFMTMNFASSSPSTNREYLVVDSEPADLSEAEAIFAADYANTPITPSGPLLVAPDNAQPLMMQLVNGAVRTVDVQAEAFSDRFVTDALVAAKARGVVVRVLVANDATPSASQTTMLGLLKAANIQVRSVGDSASGGTAASPYNHAKALVVDGVRAYVGSANFTTNSLRYNRELGVMIGNLEAVNTVAATFAGDFARGKAL